MVVGWTELWKDFLSTFFCFLILSIFSFFGRRIDFLKDYQEKMFWVWELSAIRKTKTSSWQIYYQVRYCFSKLKCNHDNLNPFMGEALLIIIISNWNSPLPPPTRTPQTRYFYLKMLESVKLWVFKSTHIYYQFPNSWIYWSSLFIAYVQFHPLPFCLAFLLSRWLPPW